MKQKLLILFACLLGTISAWAQNFEATNSEGVTIYYKVTDATKHTCKVTNSKYKDNLTDKSQYSGEINIPETVTSGNVTYTVKEIGSTAFYAATATTVTIPSSVNKIGAKAFFSSGITSINIPSEVTSISEDAFDQTENLESFTVEEGNQNYKTTEDQRCLLNMDGKIGAFAPSGLTEYTIPADVGITEIGFRAFGMSINLTSLVVPEGVTTIGQYAICSCSSLTSISLPSTLETIEKWAFIGCTKLSSITIPKNVKSLGENALRNCAFTSVTFEGEPTLGNEVFYNQSSLASIENLSTVNISPNASGEFMSSLASALGEKANTITPITSIPCVLTEGVPYTSLGFGDTEITINYSRTFSKDCWQALFLPFSLTEEEWSEVGTVAKLKSVTFNNPEITLNWETISGDTEAGKPYIIKPSSKGVTLSINGEKTLVPNTTNSETAFDRVTIGGTYAVKDMSAVPSKGSKFCYWGLADGNFHYTNSSEKTLQPYRIYLIAPAPTSPSYAPIRNSIGGSDATEIEGLMIEQVQNDDCMYNLSGQKVGEDYKGLVIKNGKVVMRK